MFGLLLFAVASDQPLHGATILITTPHPYAARLKTALVDRGARVVHLEAVRTDLLRSRSDKRLLRQELRQFRYVAFTSRRGIEGVTRACGSRVLCRRGMPTPIALGADAEALVACGVPRARVLVPRTASPAGIVALLRARVPRAERASTPVLCPVPRVVGLQEPPVVPRFLRALRRAGFANTRSLPAYETRWPGAQRDARAAIARLATPGAIDAIAVTSTAEVEGLQRYCSLYLGGGGRRLYSLRRVGVPVIAHGPVTAAGARARGVRVAATNRRFASFAGLAETVAALCTRRRAGAAVLAFVDSQWLLE